jgi:hypothetical protein
MIANRQSSSVSPEALGRKHEASDPNLRPALWAAVLVAVSTVGCLAIVGAILWLASRHSAPSPALAPTTIVSADTMPLQRFPSPSLQINPSLDLSAWREHENLILGSYAWVNRTSGVIRIPVERAMELTLRRGLPARATNQQPPTGASSLELLRQRSQNR